MLSALVGLLLFQSSPPEGAIILFDGKDAAEWQSWGRDPKPCPWKVVDGSLEVTSGSPDIRTKREFGSFKLHIEFWLPNMPDQKDQGKANSGVYSHGRYEVQVLDSWKNPTYKFGGCGALYGQKDPDKDAIKPPETWNTYDIEFRAPSQDASTKEWKRPRITVRHNGTLIHDNVEILEAFDTATRRERTDLTKGPIRLQNHGCPVRYRNIWVLPLE